MGFLTQNFKSHLIHGILFLVCGLPGLFLFLVFSTALFGVFFDPHGNFPHPVYSIGGVAGGILLMLIGVGKWGQWRYILVFVSIPVALFSSILMFPGADKSSPGIFVGIVAFFTLFLVRRFWRQSERSKKHNERRKPEI